LRFAPGGYVLGMESRWSLWSEDSLLSIGSRGSVLSVGSVGSILSLGSVGSAGSVLSAGSAGSVASLLSAGSIGAVMSSGARGPLGRPPQGRERLVGAAVTGLVGVVVAVLVRRAVSSSDALRATLDA
jgi:hypothetical protein